MKSLSRISASFLICVIIAAFACFNVFALDVNNLSEGTYNIEASLSCYVNAMGGIEFGKPLLTDSSIEVDSNGNKKMTLNFTKSSVTIYNITCDTFIDINPPSTDESRGVTSGTIGYYDKNGNVQTAEYTLSDDKALNPRDESVNYVDSMTFPLDEISDTYNLTMYINSNVMGVQFCNANDKATEATYSATLTVDWNSLKLSSEASESSSETSNNNSVVGEDELETLPAETQTQPATEETSVLDGEVIEKDGLNIHYVNGENDDSNSDSGKASYTAYLNIPALIAVAIGAGVVILIGVAFLISSKSKKDKKKVE